MSIRTDENRRNLQAARDHNKDLRSWLGEAFSTALNLRNEPTCANPDYAELVRAGITSADDSPNTTPPGAAGWHLKGYWGLHGYLVFDGGTSPNADLQLWAHDPAQDNWFLVETKSAVDGLEEFHFNGKVRNRTVFLRVSAIAGSPTSVALHCSPE